MEDLGVITKIQDPTDWCAGMVVPNGDVQICVDITRLNRSVRRELHTLLSVEGTLAQLGGAKYFFKLDAISGFWQVELEPESPVLTTFITPFGRYCFNRLPFGITSVPELFQRKVSEILTGLLGVVSMMDDILVYAASKAEHDRRFETVLHLLKKHGVTLNREKCEFSKDKVKFLGQIIEGSIITPDPNKIKAVREMYRPTSVLELRVFLGMVNHLSKFAPHMSDKTKPLRDLLSTKSHWLWDFPQEKAFQTIKETLGSDNFLACYDPHKETLVSSDASSYGLAAVLKQKHHENWKPVAVISRSLSVVEQRYVCSN